MTDPLFARLGHIPERSKNENEHMMAFLRELGVTSMLTELRDSTWKEVVLPSAWVSKLLESPRDFRLSFGADVQRTKEFWQAFCKDPQRVAWKEQHPFLKGRSLDDLQYTIPCCLHQDAGPVSKKLSAYCISFGSILSQGQEKVSRFLLAIAIKRKTIPLDWAVWEAVLQDLDCLAQGLLPSGEPLRDRQGGVWSFCLMTMRADEEARCNNFGFPHWGAREHVCPDCLADRAGMAYTNLMPDALWRNSEAMSLADFKARSSLPAHPLIASHYFTRHLFLMDLMHCMDCKGGSYKKCSNVERCCRPPAGCRPPAQPMSGLRGCRPLMGCRPPAQPMHWLL